MTDTITSLIEKLEGAEVGEVRLDVEIAKSCGYYVPPGPMQGWHDPDGKHIGLPPRFSQSLDAALALAERVLPGWEGEIDFGRRGFACLHPEQPYPAHLEYNAEARTPALALCAAILRAQSEARATGEYSPANEGECAS